MLGSVTASINDAAAMASNALPPFFKMNKPTIKRIKQEKPPVLSDYDIANNIAKSFTNKQYAKPVENARLKADIAIQNDILDYLNAGNVIITRKSRKKTKALSTTTLSYYKKVSL